MDVVRCTSTIQCWRVWWTCRRGWVRMMRLLTHENENVSQNTGNGSILFKYEQVDPRMHQKRCQCQDIA